MAAPEHSRLVVRQYEGRSRLGGALAEAAFGPAARSLAASDGPAAEGEQDAGVAAALSPRADPALLACLLSIYRGLALK